MLANAMSGSMSGHMSGNPTNPTCVSPLPSITWTLYVRNVGFLRQERAPENLNHRGRTDGLE